MINRSESHEDDDETEEEDEDHTVNEENNASEKYLRVMSQRELIGDQDQDQKLQHQIKDKRNKSILSQSQDFYYNHIEDVISTKAKKTNQ